MRAAGSRCGLSTTRASTAISSAAPAAIARVLNVVIGY